MNKLISIYFSKGETMEIKQLRQKQILEFCKSCLNDYLSYLTINEIAFIKNILNDQIFDKSQIDKLLNIAEKIWNNELATDKYVVISWSKYAEQKEKSFITFATLSRKDDIISFCNSNLGIEYSITFKALIGALNKDGATLIEDISKKNEYTLAIIDNKVINSYNGATRLITPIQLLDQTNNDYPSKHNELILDSRYITEKREINISRN